MQRLRHTKTLLVCARRGILQRPSTERIMNHGDSTREEVEQAAPLLTRLHSFSTTAGTCGKCRETPASTRLAGSRHSQPSIFSTSTNFKKILYQKPLPAIAVCFHAFVGSGSDMSENGEFLSRTEN